MATAHNPFAPTQKAPEGALTAEEAPEPQEPEETVEEPQGVPEGPAAEVLEWVGDDKDRAKEALESEEAGQQRVGLTKKLKEIAE